MSTSTTCLTCELNERRDRGEAPAWDCIHRTDNWYLVHSYNTSLLGWLVLIARRHMRTVAEMTHDEATDLGRLQREVSIALEKTTGCQKTYIAQFAESPEHPHVHFHIIARMSELPEKSRGPGVFQHLGVTETQRVSEAA